MSCECGGKLVILGVPFELWARCSKCGKVYVFLPDSKEFHLLYGIFLSKKFRKSEDNLKMDVNRMIREIESLEEELRRIKEKLIEIVEKRQNIQFEFY